MGYDPAELGLRISNARRDKVLTQSYMGKQLEMSQAAYCRIEHGKADVTVSCLYKISSILGVSIIWLLSDESIIGLTDGECLVLESILRRNKRIRGQ